MGIQNFVNVIRKSRKSLLHLAMLTSIVAAAAVTFPPTVTAAAQSSTNHHQQPDQHQQQPYDSNPHQQQQQQQSARPAIPYCNDKHDDRTISRRLLYVTTLDGRISALDIAKGGKLRWSIQTGPGPLISSSIHRLELTNNGRFVRMIPSLSGGIYKFDGKTIDPIPITTENLLSSSAKFSDDLVVSGGKETRTYGVSARTGQLLYECSMHGCINATDAVTSGPDKYRDAADEETNSSMPRPGGGELMQHDPLLDDVIVVRRHTQTVRAVESRTGVERWNFSVGQHELNMIRSEECHDRQLSDFDMAINDLEIKVIVPEGVICAFSKTNPNSMLWKYKFDHPIVSGWKMGGSADELQPIDMFGSAQWLWDSDNNIFESPYPTSSPSIYLGMYDKQLYIQESIKIRREIDDQSNLYTHLTSGEESMPSIPWRPIPASSGSLVIFQGADSSESPYDTSQVIEGHELVPYDEDNFAVSALSVLNASEYVNGNGFYLYTSKDLNKSGDLCDEPTGQAAITDRPASETAAADDSNDTHKDDLDFNFDDLDAPVKVVVLSLWYWWKEILVIAFTSALVFNFFLSQRHRPQREIVVIERHIPVPTAIEATEASTVALLGPVVPPGGGTASKSPGHDKGLLANRSLSESTSHSGEHYTSRFQGDFDLLRCLGRGGFGVVFETKNKLDDCKYAVKRITLPNKKESRDRVMREVKTLANCEHQNIVRYFQAWVETPPPGWQEEEDSKWLAHEMSTSIQIETPDGTTLPSFASGVQAVEHATGNHLLLDKKKQLLSWVSSVTSVACSSDHEDHNCIKEADENDYGGGDDDDEDEDSSIVFRSESQSQAHRDESSSSSSSNSSSSSGDDEAHIPKYRRTKTKPKPRQIRQIDDAVAIDIHSHSFDAKSADYSQLSDSFQIEFVRPADEQQADDDDDDDGFSEEGSSTPRGASTTTASASDATNKTKIMQRRKLALDLTNNNNNNHNNRTNGKAVQAGSSRTPPTKPSQNRLYLYIQMQLCRKESLRDWLRENTTALREAHIASIFHQIVDAVDYVHFKGLIHRDLKPSNIFFSQDGQIKIGDFGLVTDMSDIPNLVTKCGDTTGLPSCSRHTQQVGTHLYMSPEQLRGQHYDYKVDIYSLGLIFFELLVYFGTEMERIVTLRDLRVGKYPEKFPHDHPDEYALLQRMLSPNPDERPATPELKRELSTILRLPEVVGDSEAAALAAAARRLSRSRTFSMNE